MEEARRPGHRAGLSRDGVIAAARDLVAVRGLDGLSMRGLAAALGVAPNALYSHVADKDGLIDLLLDDALRGIEVPAAGTDAVDGLRQIMTSTYRMLSIRPDLVPLYLVRQGSRGPNAQRLGGIMNALLAEAGVPDDGRQPAIRVLLVHTIGSAAFATPGGTGVLTSDQLLRTFQDGLGWLLTGITAVR